jgi:hypothetical protein
MAPVFIIPVPQNASGSKYSSEPVFIKRRLPESGSGNGVFGTIGWRDTLEETIPDQTK